MSVWFTSDLHFNHDNIIGFCNRPFKDVNHMNEEMIKRWNSRIQPNDKVIVVGDVMFGGDVSAQKYVHRLNGHKILVKGNHDHSDNKMSVIGFEFIFERLGMMIAKQFVNISHYPYHPKIKEMSESDKKNLRYLDRRIHDDGEWLIHGHTHDKVKLNGKQIHVGVDAWDFYPVNIKTIGNIIQSGKIK